MKPKYMFTILLFTVIIISGCASTANRPSAVRTDVLDLQKVKKEIEVANQYLEAGNPEKAQAAYQMVIERYSEIPARYECGILTNASLASLQMGDGRRFTEYAHQLEAAAAYLRPLPRNTQIVLAIMQVSGMRTTDAELWINQSVEQAVRLALTAN